MILIVGGRLRSHQLSLDDPYNNPYTNWSTACLLLSLLMFIVGAIWSLNRISRGAPVPILVWLWLVLFAVYFGWMFLNFVAFLAPM